VAHAKIIVTKGIGQSKTQQLASRGQADRLTDGRILKGYSSAVLAEEVSPRSLVGWPMPFVIFQLYDGSSIH
jgi:hypothetical protein